MRQVKQILIVSAVLAGLCLTASIAAAKDADMLFPIIKNDRWGYINNSGKIVVAPQYDHASYFSEGLGLVKTAKPDQEVFCIDAKGKKVFDLNPSWSHMAPYKDGLAAVKDKGSGLYGYVDGKGRLVIPHKYSSAADFAEGLAKVEIKDKQNKTSVGYINTKGEMVIKPDQWLKASFSDGMAAVRMEKEGRFVYGIMDAKGKMVIAPRFKNVGAFGEGLAFVNDNGQIQIIDKKGTPVAKFGFKVDDFDKMPVFSDGFAKLDSDWKFPTGFWGFVDKKGKLAFPKLDMTFIKTPFSQERAWIKLRGSNDLVLIDTRGKVYAKVANVQDALEFKGGLSAVVLKKEKNIYYYDRDGKLVWK